MADLGEPLSERELDVLRCVVQGNSNHEIARDLSISPNTVKVHLRNIFTKLGVASRTEASTAALRQGLLTVPGVEIAPQQETQGNSGELAITRPMAETQEIDIPLSEPHLPISNPQSPTSNLQSPISNLHPTTEFTSLLPPSPAPRSPLLAPRSRWLLAGLVALIVLPLLVLAGFRLVTGNATPTPSPTTGPFPEQPIGDNWLASRPMTAGRANMASAAVGLNLYLIGGETAEGVANTVAVYNIGLREWHTVESKPTSVADASAAVLFGEIYVLGGRLPAGEPTDVVEAYSPTNNAWRPVASLPQPVAGGLAMSDNSSLYLFGGWNGEEYLADSYWYDPNNGRWRPIAPMAQPRAYATGGVIGNRPYVIGGFDGQSDLDLCQYYELTEDAWFDCPPMLQPRSRAGAAVLLNKLYVVGGGGETSELAFSEVFDADTQTWTPINTPMLADHPGWHSLAVATVETRIFALGGRTAETFLPVNYVYQPFVYQFFFPSTSFGNETP